MSAGPREAQPGSACPVPSRPSGRAWPGPAAASRARGSAFGLRLGREVGGGARQGRPAALFCGRLGRGAASFPQGQACGARLDSAWSGVVRCGAVCEDAGRSWWAAGEAERAPRPAPSSAEGRGCPACACARAAAAVAGRGGAGGARGCRAGTARPSPKSFFFLLWLFLGSF